MRKILLGLFFISMFSLPSYSNEIKGPLSDKTIADYKKAIRSNTQLAESYNDSAIISFKKDAFGESTELYKKVLKLYPLISQNYMNLGDAYYSANDYANAIESYQAAIQFDPDNRDIYYKLGVVYERIGYDQRAMEYYKKAAETIEKEQ